MPAFAKAVYFPFETFSCKAQSVTVSISVYGISSTSFQHIRTSLYVTGFGFPLPPPSPSSAVAKVQTRSVSDRITWTGKAQAGFQYTPSLVHQLSTPAPHRWDGASPPTATLQLPPPAPSRLWPVRVKRKQNKEKAPSFAERLSHNEQILFQSRWDKNKRSSFISQLSLERWIMKAFETTHKAGGRARGNACSTACSTAGILLLTVTLLGGALRYPKLDGLYLTTALAVRSSGQGCDELLGDRHSSPCIALLGCTSDFKVILSVELSLLDLTGLYLKSWPPISTPFPHSLCI